MKEITSLMLKTKNFSTMWNWIAAMLIIPGTAYVSRVRQSSFAFNKASGITILHHVELLGLIKKATFFVQWYKRLSSLLYTLSKIGGGDQWWTDTNQVLTDLYRPFSLTRKSCDHQNVPSVFIQRQYQQHHSSFSFKSP